MPKKKKSGGKKSKGGKKGKKYSLPADAYRPPPLTPEESLHECLRRTRWWLEEEEASIRSYLTKWRQENMSTEDFQVAMRYLQIPVSGQQFQLLIKYLDPVRTDSIHIKLLMNIMSKTDQELLNIAYTTSLIDPPGAEEEQTDKKGKKKGGDNDAEKALAKKDKRGGPCLRCGIALMEPPLEYQPKFVQIQLTLATFRDLSQHPAHFAVTTTTGTTIHGLIDIITKHLHKSITMVAVFNSPTCSKESYLNPSWSLSDCGLEGSHFEYEPIRYQLYYDFIPEFHCPILMADNAMRNISPILKKRLHS